MGKSILSKFVPLMLVCILFTQAAQAIEPRDTQHPRLSFDGTTARCSVLCRGNNEDDLVSATLRLYQGKTPLGSWNGSGKGRASVYGECTVESGKSYTLMLTYSINGVSQPAVSTIATCP